MSFELSKFYHELPQSYNFRRRDGRDAELKIVKMIEVLFYGGKVMTMKKGNTQF